MKFIPANEIKKLFDVTGSFYELELNNIIYKCRNKLEIKSKKYKNADKPDIIVVMMNPGSSKPKDKNHTEKRYNLTNLKNLIDLTQVETQPDPTQYQIMRIMHEKKLNYSIVLNLSDLRSGNSRKFSKIFDSLYIVNYAHPDSIFNDLREKELNSIIESCSNKILLAGWGNLTNQEEFMKKAINKFSTFKVIGSKSENCKYCYAHPKPQLHKQQLNWLKNTLNQLET